MEMLLYIGKVNLYWVLLLACYRLMLRNHTFFQCNRIYLLGSIVAAFALPFVIYPADAPPIPVIYAVSTTLSEISFVQKEQPLMTWMDAAWLLYASGLAVAGFFLLRNIFQLRRFISSGDIIELDDCTLVMMNSNQTGSFSFLKWIVINRQDYESHFDDILSHELVHTRQWHSADILFVEIMKVLFWFNPILVLYKRDLQQVHEFLADSKASNRENYAQFLVSYALNAPAASLTNHFFKPSQIKSRIQMIYKNRSSKWLLGTYLAVATLIGVTAVLVAGCEQKEDKQPETEKSAEKMPEKVFTEVEKSPAYPGGETAMFQFLGKNIRYPTAAANAGVQGKVFVSFIITETGTVQNVTVAQGIGFGCDEEAVRVIKNFPAWTPGEQNGHKVNVKLTLPINFMLEENSSKKLSAENTEKSPLYLVDGQEMNKEDVEKNIPADRIAAVNVIKDTKALAAYGSKARDGVIKISTKPGNSGAARQATVVHISDKRTTESKAPVSTDKPDAAAVSDAKVQVSGNESLFSEPLYIIDGVRQKRGFATKDLDTEKIQSINVLKNQSATAAYGEEGRNGVILISTRKN